VRPRPGDGRAVVLSAAPAAPPKSKPALGHQRGKVRQACWGVYIAGGGECPAGSHRARYVGRVVEGVMGGIFSRNLQARFLHTEID
jgi:hypothetical protein